MFPGCQKVLRRIQAGEPECVGLARSIPQLSNKNFGPFSCLPINRPKRVHEVLAVDTCPLI